VKKPVALGASVSDPSSSEPTDNVEIITRPDGTKVRRIRKTKPKAVDDSVGLSGFLNSQPKSIPKGGSATVAGDRVLSSELKDGKENGMPLSPSNKKESLDGFLGKMDLTPRKIGGSASVAGDQLAVSRDSSLIGEIYVRADGTKGKPLEHWVSIDSLQHHANSAYLVRRVKKPVTQALPGDQVEIITRPDGTKVRRIRRAKKPESVDSNASSIVSLESFLGSANASMPGSSATVAGDYAEGEIYIRADGKKYVSRPS
jgi:hypothetical protein